MQNIASVPRVISLYLDHLARRLASDDYSRDALSNTKRELERFAVAHPFAVSECRQHNLTAWIEVNPQWESAHTKKRVIAGIVACFRWAAEEELIDRCPYRRVKVVSNLPYVARRPADHKEYVALMRHGSRALRRALFFLRRIGARTCEMRGLLWTDCILDGPAPHVCLYKHKTHRKTGKPRKIGLDVATANWLRAMRRRAASAWVFTNCNGDPWKRCTFCVNLRGVAKRAGLDETAASRVTAYCLRHTYVVDGIEGGLTTRQIADQVGHETTDMIDRIYGSHTRQREEHLAKVAEAALRARKRA